MRETAQLVCTLARRNIRGPGPNHPALMANIPPHVKPTLDAQGLIARKRDLIGLLPHQS